MHTNQRLVVEELRRRGAVVVPVDGADPAMELMRVTAGSFKDLLLDRFSSAAPYHVVKMSADKHLTKNLLRAAGISVPDGRRFTPGECPKALDYAEGLGFPVVLKPNWGSHGDGVVTFIQGRHELEAAVWRHALAFGWSEPFLVEASKDWYEHRVFATSSGGFAVVRRDPAGVDGDGRSTVRELVGTENRRRAASKAAAPTSTCPIVLDDEVDRFMRCVGWTGGLDHVPAEGERVGLRSQSNLAKGGTATDVTDEVHDSVRRLARSVLDVFAGLPCVGIDVMCVDPRQPLSADDHWVIEVNSNPGLAMHAYPHEGRPRDVASDLVDAMFPWIGRKV